VYALDAATGALVWAFRTGNAVNSSPAVANGIVYIGSEDRNFYALNAMTGARVWTFTTGDFVVSSSAAVAYGTVFFGSADHRVYALRAVDGTLVLRVTTGGPVASSPTVANGVVYTGAFDGIVRALDATTGANVPENRVSSRQMPDRVRVALPDGRLLRAGVDRTPRRDCRTSPRLRFRNTSQALPLRRRVVRR
jgi:outer membrane protein assembly factor BamB